MLLLARQPARSLEPVRAPAVRREPDVSVGKRTLTAELEAGHLGTPDFYTRAIENALRELAAVRSRALPAFVAVLRRTDLAPLAREIERTRVALQVRHLLRCANASIHALELAATARDSMLEYLRESLDTLVARATALGVYRDALDQRPRRAVDDDKPHVATHSVKPKRTRHQPPVTRSSLVPTQPAQITRARTRLARGTGAPPPNLASSATSPTPAARNNSRPGLRPGFRL